MKNKEKQDNESVIRIVGIIIIIVILSYAGSNSLKRYKSLKENPRYTIGYTTRKYDAVKGPMKIEFRFNYRNKQFNGDCSYVEGITIPNGRYFVKFSTKEPKYHNFTYIPVPNSIVEAPIKGWAEIPKMNE